MTATKSLFVNVCHSKVLEAPLDEHGKKITGDLANVNGPQIPLLVGPIRNVDEIANAVDVVVHPMVLDCCKRHPSFQLQLSELAMQWIMEDTNVKITKGSERTEEDVSYYGGLGDNKDIPVLLHVTKEMLEGQQGNGTGKKRACEDALSSTSSLLSHIHKGGEEALIKENIKIERVASDKKKVDSKPANSPSLPAPSSTSSTTSSKKVIEEIGSSKEVAAKAEAVDKKA
ncbi:hypothetical protein EON65_54725, partial [archaeon]